MPNSFTYEYGVFLSKQANAFSLGLRSIGKLFNAIKRPASRLLSPATSFMKKHPYSAAGTTAGLGGLAATSLWHKLPRPWQDPNPYNLELNKKIPPGLKPEQYAAIYRTSAPTRYYGKQMLDAVDSLKTKADALIVHNDGVNSDPNAVDNLANIVYGGNAPKIPKRGNPFLAGPAASPYKFKKSKYWWWPFDTSGTSPGGGTLDNLPGYPLSLAGHELAHLKLQNSIPSKLREQAEEYNSPYNKAFDLVNDAVSSGNNPASRFVVAPAVDMLRYVPAILNEAQASNLGLAATNQYANRAGGNFKKVYYDNLAKQKQMINNAFKTYITDRAQNSLMRNIIGRNLTGLDKAEAERRAQ